jgi:hypothetical protein
MLLMILTHKLVHQTMLLMILTHKLVHQTMLLMILTHKRTPMMNCAVILDKVSQEPTNLFCFSLLLLKILAAIN